MGGELTANCTTWLSIDCCCDTYPRHVSLIQSLSADLRCTNLVDEDRLPEFFNELYDCSRILRFIENPSRFSFPQQFLGSFLNVFQGSTDD